MFKPGYIGSKAGVFRRIIGEMPPHTLYVEPFFGSGAIFWKKRPADRSIVIDQDAATLATVRDAAGVIAFCGDASSILPTLNLPADALVYCDPPYLLSTRKNRRYYQFEMSDADHARLLDVLKALPCYVMISGYDSELYRGALHGWRVCSYRVRTRGRTVDEFLWCNFERPAALHDWRYTGLTWRERYNLKRYADRLLARTPERKRGYLLHILTSTNSTAGEPCRRLSPPEASGSQNATAGECRSIAT
jgi:DNA adenine methylase